MRITRDNTAAVVIDVQERLFPHMDNGDRTMNRIATLIRGLQTLAVPILLTEQYPKGLGPTVQEVRDAFGEPPEPIVKASFSCCDDTPFQDHLQALHRSTVLVAGIESHVCVLQTTIDLLERGFSAVVVMDAVSSRNPFDKDVAARRIEKEGGRLATVESVLFELTRVSGTDEFREISRLIR